MLKTPVYLEIIDFIAAGPTPAEVAAFHPSERPQQRVQTLLRRQKSENLKVQEEAELEHYMQLEHLMRLAKGPRTPVSGQVSGGYISAKLRLEVVLRVEEICEYCLVHRHDGCFGHAVDHVISVKHGGRTELDNLALSCASCHQRKGTDIGSIVQETERFVALFNPRCDAGASTSSSRTAH